MVQPHPQRACECPGQSRRLDTGPKRSFIASEFSFTVELGENEPKRWKKEEERKGNSLHERPDGIATIDMRLLMEEDGAKFDG